MKIKKIHAENFKSIEVLDFNFENVHGIWELSGEVGSGKTTLGEAVLFGLFGTIRDKNNTTLIRWGQKRALLEIWLESGGKKIHIKRTINLQGQCPIEVDINGEPLVFTNKKDAQMILERDYYDVSRLTCEMLCIISFNGFKSFSNLNPGDVRFIMDNVFMMNTLTEYVGRCDEFCNELNQEVNTLITREMRLETQMEQYRRWKNSKKITDEAYNEAVNKLNEAKANDRELQKQWKKLTGEVNAEIDAIKKEIADVTAQGKVKSDQIKLLQKGKCPTCGHTLNTDELPKYMAEKEVLLKKWQELTTKRDELKAKLGEDVAGFQGKEAEIRKEIDYYSGEVRVMDESRKDAVEFAGEIEQLSQELETIQAQKEVLAKDVREWKDLQNFFAVTIREKMISSIVPKINHYCNNFLIQLGINYNIELDGKFKCLIRTPDAAEPIPVKSLSTGQAKVVDMVIILSILKVLMNGVDMNVVFLDELFSNMHSELRNSMCNLLKTNINPSKSVFVISHATLDGNVVDGVIEVKQIDGKTSYSIQ